MPARYQLSVCRGPDCRAGGADGVYRAATHAIATEGLEARCQIVRGGCYGLCEIGPNVVIREGVSPKPDPLSREMFQLMGWPSEVHYPDMSPTRMEQVVREHIGEDRPVEAFRAPPDGGS
ncbi:MAG: (2Fe-2S) ferredoxin domain-containing protein [Myxococcaceae bacterium]